MEGGSEGMGLLRGGEAPLPIHPGEGAADLNQCPRLLGLQALCAREVGQRREVVGGSVHVSHGAPSAPELREEENARGNALTVGQALGDLERPGDVGHRLGIGVAAGRRLGRLLQVAHGPRVVSGVLEVRGQLGGDVPHPIAMTSLLSLADRLVPGMDPPDGTPW